MGPLAGFRVVEFYGSGPGPFAGMLLADMGADVLLVDRVGPPDAGRYGERRFEAMMRGKRSVVADLKAPGTTEALLRIVERADALIDVFRPGVLERLGLGPEACLARNPRLVYGRMTGWGQTGPRALAAGHDVDYVAVTGVLNGIGRAGEPPTIPLNLVGDMGGGGMLLAYGITCALLEASRSGLGQVVDAAMFEGASLQATLFAGMLAAGRWQDARGVNRLDGSAPWYAVYETADARHVAVGANEDAFYAELLAGLGLDAAALPSRQDRASWPRLREAIARAFRSRTRDDWCALFEGRDACVAPVLTFAEARDDAHAVARGSFVDVAGVPQPAPAPRLSRTPPAVRRPPPRRGEGGREALGDWGFDADGIAALESLGLRLRQAGTDAAGPGDRSGRDGQNKHEDREQHEERNQPT